MIHSSSTLFCRVVKFEILLDFETIYFIILTTLIVKYVDKYGFYTLYYISVLITLMACLANTYSTYLDRYNFGA